MTRTTRASLFPATNPVAASRRIFPKPASGEQRHLESFKHKKGKAKMKNKKLLIGIGIIALLGIISVGIYKTHYQRIDGDVTHVGIILPLTGTLAYEGDRIKSAMMLAEKQCQNDKIKLHFGDGCYTVKDSINAFNQIRATQEIDVWIIFGDLPLMGMREMLTRTGKPVICLIGAQDLIKGRERFIHFSGSIVLPAKRLANYAADSLLDTVAVVYHKEDIGEEVVKTFCAVAKERNVTVVAQEAIASENVDVKSIVAKILGKKPKAIFVYAYASLYVSMLNQIKNQQYEGVILTDTNISAVRDKVVDGGVGIVYGDFDFGEGCTNQETKKFIQDMKTDFNVTASSFSAFAYETIRVLSNVIKVYGKTPDEIERGFYEVKDYPSIVGTMTCVKDGEQKIPIIMKRIEKIGSSVVE